MEFDSCDDDIPNIWKNKIHVPNHQPAIRYNVIYIPYKIIYTYIVIYNYM